jgi:hypothetical protein
LRVAVHILEADALFGGKFVDFSAKTVGHRSAEFKKLSNRSEAAILKRRTADTGCLGLRKQSCKFTGLSGASAKNCW